MTIQRVKLIVQISLVMLLFGCGGGKKDPIKFDSSDWKADKNSRYLMVDDIIENDRLLDKSKDEVIQLLGNPTEKGPCDNCIGYSTYEPDQGFSLDHAVLQINFDDQNKVTGVAKNHW